MRAISCHLDKRIKLVFVFSCIVAFLCYVATSGVRNKSCSTFQRNWDYFVARSHDEGLVGTPVNNISAMRDKSAEDTQINSDDTTVTRNRIAEDVRRSIYLQYIKSNDIMNHSKTVKREKRLPDVIGIGVEKCGTGPLQWMMVHHPMIVGSKPIELHFFGSGRKGKEYYRNMMPEVASYELASEKTPAYFNFGSPNIPNTMKEIVPDAKLIAILCDPVNRTYSDFVQEKIMKSIRSDADFEKLMNDLLQIFSKMPRNDDSAAIEFIYKKKNGKSHIISTGLYYYHLLRWFRTYKKSQIHIVNGEELLNDPGKVMEKVQEFLDIPRLIIKEDFVRNSSGFFCINTPTPVYTDTEIKLEKGEKPDCMPLHAKGRTRMGRWQYKPSQAIMERLRKFYAPHNKKLYDLLGREFDWQ